MTELLVKLNYKSQQRVAVINADEEIITKIFDDSIDIVIDRKIDPRYPYGFMIIFARNKADIEKLTPQALHNLVADGVLWFCYPKKTSTKYRTDVDRDHGWDTLNDSGLRVVRIVSIDDDWSAMKFRNIKYIK